MPNEGRFLGKQMLPADGVEANEGAAIVEEGGKWTIVGGARIGGSGTPLLQIASLLASIDVGQIEPAGSSGAQVVNVPFTGVTPGDQIIASPVASLPLHVVWGAACYSAGAVNIRVIQTASGNIDMGATDWRITAIRHG